MLGVTGAGQGWNVDGENTAEQKSERHDISAT